VLYGAGQLAVHIFDAGMFVASIATLYRLYLRHATSPGTPDARRSSGSCMGLRLAMLAVLHLQVLQAAVLGSPPADRACLLLAEALVVAGRSIGACDPTPPRRRVPQPAQVPVWFTE